MEERPFRAAKRRLPQKAQGNQPLPRIFVMQSSGGITALSTAAREPVRTVLSGPAGVLGALTTARASGFEHIIAFDMGGTSTDVSLVEGEIKTATDAQIAGLPIGIPMLDIHTVGAGGGSVARFDSAGVLRSGRAKLGGPSFCPVRRNETENEDLLARRTNPDPNLQRSSHPHRIQRHYSDPSGETFPPGRSWKRNHLALIFSRRVPLWPSLPSRGNVSASNCYNPVKIAPEAHELHTAH